MKYIHTLFCFLVTLLMFSPAYATLNTKNFGALPILHEGRIKPLDTFARISLKQIYGRESFENYSATDWLATSLFDPHTATTQKIFRIENPNIRHALGLTERKRPLYAFNEISLGLGKTIPKLEPILAKDKKERSKDDTDLLNLHEAAINYTQIIRSLSLILPLNIAIPKEWQNTIKTDADGTLSYLNLKKIEQSILDNTKKIIAEKGDDLTRYTKDEQSILLFSYQLDLLQNAAQRNEILRIIPSPWIESKDEWFSPWSLYQTGQASPQTAPFIESLKDMARAYNSQQQSDFDKSIVHYNEQLKIISPAYSHSKLIIETIVQTLNPQSISLILYGIVFILSLFLLAFPSAAPRALYTGTQAAFLIGLGLHGIDILARIYILSRPPVSTLYESIIFVSFISVLIAALMERKSKDGLGITLGTIAALILGMVGASLTSFEDTKVMLSAVLNTQFWLATHVICITLGYAWCVILSIFAHLILLKISLQKISEDNIKSLHSLTLIALLLTAIGTILGGIWADQSWGRFWGWDPKENGALLIVLWLTWILHGGLASTFSRITMLALLALTSIIVALAWIGVNLLGVGLHSYGFTEGLFWGLALFISLESIIIAALSYAASRKKLSHAS